MKRHACLLAFLVVGLVSTDPSRLLAASPGGQTIGGALSFFTDKLAPSASRLLFQESTLLGLPVCVTFRAKKGLMFLTYLNADAADLAVQIRPDATLTQCFPTLNRFIVDCLSGVKKACEYE